MRAWTQQIPAVVLVAGLGGPAPAWGADVCTSSEVRVAVAPAFTDDAAALRVRSISIRVQVPLDEEGVPQSVEFVERWPYEPLERAVAEAARGWRFAAKAAGGAMRTATIHFLFTLHERVGSSPKPSTVFRLPCEVEVHRYYNPVPMTESGAK